jgi:hypothetical protein
LNDLDENPKLDEELVLINIESYILWTVGIARISKAIIINSNAAAIKRRAVRLAMR